MECLDRILPMNNKKTHLFLRRLKDKLSHFRKIIFLFFNQNICCGYSKEPSPRDGSFQGPKDMPKIMGKKVFTILR